MMATELAKIALYPSPETTAKLVEKARSDLLFHDLMERVANDEATTAERCTFERSYQTSLARLFS